jgi:cation-transporting ATPase F
LLAAIIAGVALPLLPTQLLWINMVTAVLLGLTLVFEMKESDLMQRPPRDPKKPLLTFPLLMRTGLVALISLAGAFGLFAWEHGTEGRNLDEARAAVVNVIVMVQTVYARDGLSVSFGWARVFARGGMPGCDSSCARASR